LDKLPFAKGARWNHVGRPTCLEGTRTEELKGINDWIHAENDHRIYLLTGLAGTGKTTISLSVALLAEKEGVLGASFFCSRDSDERSNISFIFPTIASLLSQHSPEFCAQLIAAVKEYPDIGHALPDEQLKRLIVEPLGRITLFDHPVVIVVDALDEGKDEKAPEIILLALSRHIHHIPFLKVFVTSRPVSSARFAIRDPSLDRLSESFILHEVQRARIDHDLGLFFRARLADMTQRFNEQPQNEIVWHSEKLVDQLVAKSSGLFIFASTICRFAELSGDHQAQLERLARVNTTNDEGRLEIDALYQEIIQKAIKSFPDETITRCRSILGTIVLLFDPLSLCDLAELLELKPSQIREVIKDLHSILLVPSKDDGIIRTFHASLHDFLTDKGRCSLRIQVQPAIHHMEITLLLFKCMTQNLKRNICEIGSFDENADVKGLEEKKAKYIGSSLSYACQYWAEHLSHVSPTAVGRDLVIGALRELMHEKLLYWIEVLNLLGKASVVVTSLMKVRSWHSVRSQKIISSRYLRMIYSKYRTLKLISTSY
jgi:hypothetical protein